MNQQLLNLSFNCPRNPYILVNIKNNMKKVSAGKILLLTSALTITSGCTSTKCREYWGEFKENIFGIVDGVGGPRRNCNYGYERSLRDYRENGGDPYHYQFFGIPFARREPTQDISRE